MSTCVSVCAWVCVSAYAYKCIGVHAYMSTCVYMCEFISVYMHKCVCRNPGILKRVGIREYPEIKIRSK